MCMLSPNPIIGAHLSSDAKQVWIWVKGRCMVSRSMQGWFCAEVRSKLTKRWDIAKGELLVRFYKDPMCKNYKD